MKKLFTLIAFVASIGIFNSNALTQTYIATTFVSPTYSCGANNFYNDCGAGTFGFSYTDVLSVGVTITSITVEFNVGVNCVGGTTHTFNFNGAGGSTSAAFPYIGCTCTAAGNTAPSAVSAGGIAAYVKGGTNTVIITGGITSCMGLAYTGAYNGYGRVTVNYIVPGPPTITSLAGSPQCAGGNITINGTNLSGATAAGVTVGGTPVGSITSNTGTTIVAVLGAGTTGLVSVTTPGGTATSISSFTVNPAPTLTGPTTATACSGTPFTYTITGGNTYTWSRAAVAGINNASSGNQTSNPINETLNNTAGVPVNTTYNITVTSAAGCNSQPVGSITTYTYSQSFTSGVGYFSGNPQYDQWVAFCASLVPQTYTSVTIKGSNDAVGVTCNDPTVTTALANALKTNGSYSAAFGGRQWLVGACNGPPYELSSLPLGQIVCNCVTLGYTVRPCISNLNWGGVNSTTCGAGSQTMTVIFTAGTVTTPNVVVTVNPPATVTTPAAACVGATITITGTNFTGATAVKFNGVNATSFTVVNSTTITAVVPNTTSGVVSVTTACGTANSGVMTINSGAPLITCLGNLTVPANAAGCVAVVNYAQNLAVGTVNQGSLTLSYAPCSAAMGVVYNPVRNLYYATSGGFATCNVNTYSSTGTLLNNAVQNLDVRGSWWNTNVSSFEANGYANAGDAVFTLNGSGYATGTNAPSPVGQFQPNAQSQGAYEASTNQVIFYDAGNLYYYNRTTGALVSSGAVTGLPAGNINAFFVGYCGIAGSEILIYDYTNRAVRFINKATRAYSASVQLVGTAPQPVNWSVGYSSDGLFWLFNGATWLSYPIMTTGNATATVPCGGPPVITYNPASGSTFVLGTTTVTATATANSQSTTCTFTVTVTAAVPTVNTPAAACVGATITITGTNFTGATAVKFNGVNATSFTVVNSTTITAVVPNTTSGVVSVTTACGTGNSGVMTITSGAPTITCLGNITVPANTAGCAAIVNYAQNLAPGTVNLGSLTLANPGCTPMGVVYNSVRNLYYAVSGGSPACTMSTYSNTGTVLLSSVQNFDFRGSWWNTNTSNFEGNDYNSGGYVVAALNGSGYATGTNAPSPVGLFQPNVQSEGAYDPTTNQVIFYDAGSLYYYNRTTGALVSSGVITGLPGGAFTQYCVGYCGVTGSEILIYDYTNRAVRFINKATRAYSASVQLVVSAPQPTLYGMSYTSDGLLWLYNGASFLSYPIMTTGNATATVPCGGPPIITYNPASGSTFALGTTIVTATATANSQSTTCTFTVTVTGAGPTVTTPAPACVGATITITGGGTGFTGATAVKFNGVNATSYTVVNSTTITAVVPNTTSGVVSVTTACGTGSSGVMTINPLPVATATPNTQTFCHSGTTAINLTSSLGGTTYSWGVPVVTGGTVTGGVAGSGSSIAQALTNTGATTATVTYTVTPTTSSSGSLIYSQSFVSGAAPTMQATAWCTFRSTLLGNLAYTKVTLKGSNDLTGVSTSVPADVLTIANALRTGTPLTLTSGGRTWSVGLGCGTSPCGTSSVEFNADGLTCSCGGNYCVRPEINNLNWGGINGTTCSAASQTITVQFDYGTTGCAGTPITIPIVIAGTNPAITNPTVSFTQCNNQTFGFTPTTNPASGVTATYTRTLPVGVTGTGPASGTGAISDVLTNNNTASSTVTYSYSLNNGCTGGPTVISVLVYPTPTIALNLGNITPAPLCLTGTAQNALVPYTTTGSPTQYSIHWTTNPGGVMTDIPVGTSLPGSPLPVALPLNVAATSYIGDLNVKISGTICASTYTGNITITPVVCAPLAYAVTPGGSPCVGAAVIIGVANSQTGVTYTLYRNAVSTGITVAGNTGSAVTFSPAQSLGGTYTVVGVNGYGTTNMTGQTVLNVSPTASPTPATQHVCITAGSLVTANGTPTLGSGTSFTTHAWTVSNAGGTGATTVANLSNANAQVVTFTTTGGMTAGTVTLQYVTTDNNGCSSPATFATIIIDAASVGGITAVTGNTEICEGDITSFILAGYTGTTFQWQDSHDGVSWANVTGGTGATTNAYTTAPLLQGGNALSRNYFRCLVSSGVCTSSPSSTRQITVDPPIVNNITADQTVCYNTAPSAIGNSVPTGGNGTYIISWEQSTVSNVGPWTVIGGANAQNYSPSALTQTTWYHRKVVSICTSFSNPVQITVTPLPTIGTASQASTVCNNTSATINLTGMLANVTVNVNFDINGTAQTPASVAANGSGNGSFSVNVNTGDVIHITGVTITSGTAPYCTKAVAFTINITTNPLPTLTGVSAASNCGTANATITMNGLQINSFFDVFFDIQGTNYSALGVASNGAGTGTFTVPSANYTNGNTLTIHSMTNTATTCSQTFSSNNTAVLVASPAITVAATPQQCMPVSGTFEFISVLATGGTPAYSWNVTNLVSPQGTNPAVYQLAQGTSGSFTVTDVNNCSAVSAPVAAAAHQPIDVIYSSSVGTAVANCSEVGLNQWVTYYDPATGKAIFAINDYLQNIGTVTGQVKVVASSQSVPNFSGNITGNCAQYPEFYMRRNFQIQSTHVGNFTSPVGVRLFFPDADLNDLETWSVNTNPPYGTQSWACALNDDVHTLGDVCVTQYEGLNEDLNYNNNDPAPPYGNGSYTFWSNNAPHVLTRRVPGNDATYGFAAVYGGPNTVNYLEFAVLHFSEFDLHGSAQGQPLPVELVFFHADAINNSYIALSWLTATEINNHGFEIERSTDGTNWTNIGWVDGHGTTTQQQNYSFTDNNVTADVVYYYRLKQIDFDNQFQYSNVETAELLGSVSFAIQDFVPNPAANQTNLMITSGAEISITVEFYNMLGQKVMASNHTLNKGGNIIPFDISKLASGTYSAIVTSQNGIYTKKVVITR